MRKSEASYFRRSMWWIQSPIGSYRNPTPEGKESLVPKTSIGYQAFRSIPWNAVCDPSSRSFLHRLAGGNSPTGYEGTETRKARERFLGSFCSEHSSSTGLLARHHERLSISPANHSPSVRAFPYLPLTTATSSMMTPTVIALSATLNAGQW